MQAGEVGFVFNFTPQDALGNAFQMTGATSIVLKYVLPGGQVTGHVACTLGGSTLTLPNGQTVAAGYWCSYISVGTDFPIGGDYPSTLEVAFSGGIVRKSAQFILTIGPASDAATTVPLGTG